MGIEVNNRLPTTEQLILFRCIKMSFDTNVCPETTRENMLDIICYAHKKGYLYTNRNANAFVCGYRIPEVNERWKNTMPAEENGEIFFVNFAISEDQSKWTLLRMLRSYLSENQDVKELVYFRRNSDTDFRHIRIRRPSNEQ